MGKVYLSDTEKKLLKALSISQYEDGMIEDLSQAEVNAAARGLERAGFIKATYSEGNNLFTARILDEGAVYLQENPTLKNQFDDEELNRLQVRNMELSNNHFELKFLQRYK